MSNITIERITDGYAKFDTVKQIYEEAFPKNERGVSIEGLIHACTLSKYLRTFVAIKDEQIVGIIVLLEKPKCCYLMYLAINNGLRGKGLGTEIMKTLLEYYSDRPIIFTIETPIQGTSNYEQRIKRQDFYERLGCRKLNVQLHYGNDSYSYFSNKKLDNAKELIIDYLKTSTAEREKYCPSEKTATPEQLIDCLVDIND